MTRSRPRVRAVLAAHSLKATTMPTKVAVPVGMSMQDFCARVGISTKTGYTWCRDGKIPVKRYGKLIRVLPDALEGFEG
jgi:Helix-turn-helix domain